MRRCLSFLFDALFTFMALFSVHQAPQASAAPLAVMRSTDCVEPWEAEVVRLTNVERAKVGLGPLVISDALSASAEHMVQDMSHYGYNGHYLHTGTSWSTNQRNHGYDYNTYRGQNVAAGQNSPADVVAAWMDSPTHKANILNPNYHVIGVGYTRNDAMTYGRFWTQDFGGYVDKLADYC